MTRTTVDLSQMDWQFGPVPRLPFNAADVNDRAAVSEWLPADVPGNVRTDLLRLDRIPDPFFGTQYQDSLWTETVDWWYRCQIPAATLEPGQQAFVHFNGIDYLSAVFVNGQERQRHEGMFSAQTINITAELQHGPVDLSVRIWGSGALPSRQLNWVEHRWQDVASQVYQSWVGIYPSRSATLKCQMSFGWDFAPPIRTMGLWDDVTSITTGSILIESTALHYQLDEANRADLTLTLRLDVAQPQPVTAMVEVAPANFAGESFGPFSYPIALPVGQSTCHLRLNLPRVERWHPWDKGYPHLYKIAVSLTDNCGKPVDNTHFRAGFRTVDLTNWQFSINGQRTFMRGVNWVPADSFPGRLRPADYEAWLQLAKSNGVNMLRVWGGGLREKQAFYDLCDELGLMVWQEFPFACVFLGTYPADDAYLDLVERECGAITRQLQTHASVIVWCGGNEFSNLRNQPLIGTLRRIVRHEDGTRPFVPVSPSWAQGKDAHNWLVWHGESPLATYRAENARFLSEFGLQALPHLDTMQAILPDPTTGWETHHGDIDKLTLYATLFDESLNGCDSLDALEAWCHASQMAQATGLQIAIEHMRRRQHETGGVCLWQFNEPWPGISWAIVDYFKRPKLAYQRLKDWYNPVLVCLKFRPRHTEIWIVNDSQTTFTDCQLHVKTNGTRFQVLIIDVPSNSARSVGHLSPPLLMRRFELIVLHKGQTIAQNQYDLGWRDVQTIKPWQRLRRWIAEWVMW